MDDASKHATPEAREYQRLLLAYADALRSGSARADELLCSADAARLRMSQSDPSGFVDETMHLTLAFSYAVDARAYAEAKRLYELMGDDSRAAVDRADVGDPGCLKIWLRARE